ncbi:hypothetical protein SAMN05444722_3225 [Rhodovulum sp. ES.010]|uniref:hypothetical protein n=1 Tax=Rhodovulum sp. ES.010 TaxID=1882821 RepID=UPI00092B5D98|nr:hypothetical protein [Rhodovulum sp. ES.010]SIO53496.1 hypothetical protein SAMN05444722_3225 [Rhodovulum sp. ES.010]
MEIGTTAGLWLAVLASGLYHGLNPGMGWPLAVSSALMERRKGALPRAVAALAAGHLVAMAALLLPFALLVSLAGWLREVQIGAAVLVIGMGLWIALTRRHPRFLARVPPSRLAMWSFLVALAHGAALMLVPIYLGLCAAESGDAGHVAADRLMSSNAATAVLVATVHTGAMAGSGGLLAWAVYRWLGLKFLSRGWFNLDLLWGLSLVGVGLVAVATAA